MSQKKKILELIDKNSLGFSSIDKLFLFLSSALDEDVEQVKKLFYSLISNGDVLAEAYKASEILAQKGVSAEVISTPVVKPFDVATLKALYEKIMSGK